MTAPSALSLPPEHYVINSASVRS